MHTRTQQPCFLLRPCLQSAFQQVLVVKDAADEEAARALQQQQAAKDALDAATASTRKALLILFKVRGGQRTLLVSGWSNLRIDGATLSTCPHAVHSPMPNQSKDKALKEAQKRQKSTN